MYGWIWIAVIVLAVIIEVLTDQLIAVWFIPGAMIGVVMDFLGGKEIWQILVVLVTTCIGIIIGRLFLAKKLKTSVTKTNVEAIIGERCIVTEKIDNYAGCGQAKVKGQIWSARGVGDDDVFEVGEALHVVAIEGVKLICKK
jgi:membrane protein implicated in regulation of membrane protease activity